MKIQWIIGLIVATVIMATSCLACCVAPAAQVYGSSHVVEQTRAVGNFHGVELATFGNLHIEIGDEEALRIEAEDNLIRHFTAQVVNGTLQIKSRWDVPLYPTRPVNFYLTAKTLDSVVLSGSGNVQVPDLEGEQISVKISGSGNVEMDKLSADMVQLHISGSGDLDVSGSEAQTQQVTIGGSGDVQMGSLDADTVEVHITGSGSVDIAEGAVGDQEISIGGSGNYQAQHLQSDDATVRITGNGSATVHVREHLEVTIRGSGDVYYTGSPAVDGKVTGSGKIKQI